MKRVLLILFLCVILIGCSSETYERDKPDLNEPGVNEYDQEGKDIDETGNKVYPEFSSELKELFAKAEKVESMQFNYDKFELKGEGDFISFFVKGDDIKQVYPIRSGEYKPGEMFDTVYISGGKILIYCEDSERCENPGELITINKEFIIETPLTVLDSIKSAEIVGSSIFDDKECTIVVDQDGRKIWVWNYRGLPIKYEIYDSDDEVIEKVTFKDLIVNQLKDKDVLR